MYNNIDNMNVLFNIHNFNNINVQNDRLLNIDPDHNNIIHFIETRLQKIQLAQ